MGKRSVKENKNIYQLLREEAGLTREEAAEKAVFVSADRIEKIESGRSPIHPDEVAALADCYRAPQLKNLYCARECPLGVLTVPEIPDKNLPEIVLQLLNELNGLDEERNRLIEIVSDGRISKEEAPDFTRIHDRLKNVASLSASLQLFMEKQQAKAMSK